MLKSFKYYLECQQQRRLQAKIAKERKIESCSDRIRCNISDGTSPDFFHWVHPSSRHH